MIRGSLGIAAAALLLSILFHTVGAMTLSPAPPEARTDGGAVQARLGNSFQDVASGVQRPVAPPQPVKAVTATDAVPPRETVVPARPAPTQTVAASPPETIRPQTPAAAATPLAPVAPSPKAPAEVAKTPGNTIAPAPPSATAATQPERLKAVPQAEDTPAPLLSARPAVRPRAIEEAAAARAEAARQRAERRRAEQRQAERQRRATQTQGTAAPAQRRGAADGQANAAATAASPGQAAAPRPGNAAISTYPGRVAQCVQRASRTIRAPRPGKAVVSFSVQPNGALARVQIARSSGSNALDRAALRAVRSASPCPAPPQGARTSFTVSVESR